jgi:hypothetical protein
VNEVANLEDVLATSDQPELFPVCAEKVYLSAKNEDLLKTKKLKYRILLKAKKREP